MKYYNIIICILNITIGTNLIKLINSKKMSADTDNY